MSNQFIKKQQAALKWILFISQRFSRVDRKGRSAITSVLASLGVCLGVMTLIVTISVMNGFQMGFKDAIMEVSSYHIRVTDVQNTESDFLQWCEGEKKIKCVTPFYEAQGLLVGSSGRQSAALVRAVPPTIMEMDKGFAKQCEIISGTFDISKTNSIVLGSDLARQLGVQVGSMVNVLALSGSSDVSLLSQKRIFKVTGIFFTGYADINSAYAYISIAAGEREFGASATRVYGVKITDSGSDAVVISQIQKAFPQAKTESWRSYNRTFFGALRVEKNMLMLLVLLIFVVVAVNIYNGMRRMVYERREEIAVITALGGKKQQVQGIFIMQGLLTGIKGSFPGLILGLFICIKMDGVFELLSKVQYCIQYFGMMIVNPANIATLSENPMYMLYASIPARIVPSEVLIITFFGIFSSLAASWAASRGVLKLTVAEVLRDE